MRNAYGRLVDAVNAAYTLAALLALVLLVVFSGLQILSRYVSGFKILGMEELARMMFVWVAALGASLGVSQHAHAKVDLVVNLVRGRLRTAWETVLELLFLAFYVIVLYYSVDKCQRVMATNQVTPLFKVPMQYLYSALIVSAIGVVLNSIRNIADLPARNRSARAEGRA